MNRQLIVAGSSVLLLVSLLWGAFYIPASIAILDYNGSIAMPAAGPHKITATYSLGYKLKLDSMAGGLQDFAKKNGFNGSHAFLIDMGMPSGQYRFFVYNFKKDSIEQQGLVAHGYGGRGQGIQFSNRVGSNCTSVGRYKIGNAYMGRFGLAYKLYGLDSSNNNAFKRFVVLHAHPCVPSEPMDNIPLCQSQGCPTIAPEFLQILKKYLDAGGRPMLMHIYK